MDETGPQISFGTAFFVHFPDERLGPGQGFCYLATARHVIESGKNDGTRAQLTNLGMWINRKPEASPPALEWIQLPLPDKKELHGWYFPEVKSVDLAILPGCPDEKLFEYRGVPTTWFVTKEILSQNDVTENDEIMFPTLFSQYSTDERNYPIIRHGRVSLITDRLIPVGKKKPGVRRSLFLLEATAFPGNSGSPVFLRLGGARDTKGGGILQVGLRYFLLGVLEATFPENTEITVGGTITQVPLNSGIAGVIPAWQLIDILEQKELKDMREQVVRGREAHRPQ